MGYVIGKAEGRDTAASTGEVATLHGHVTAITIAPEYRRLGLAKGLMWLLEDVSDRVYNAWFVDLFVRPSNQTAVTMYERMGYHVYRKVTAYYYRGAKNGSDEDGYDMRKSLPRDKHHKTTRTNGRLFAVDPQDTLFDPAYRP